MATQLSVKAQALSQEISIKPNIILDIEGVNLIFGAMPVFKTLEWDDENAFWDDGLNWDSVIKDINSRDYISFNGSTTSLSQQIAPDKGNTSSITTANISLIDKNGEVSKALSFDAIEEILGRKATLSIGFQDGAHSVDSNRILSGVVVDFYTDAGTVMVSIASSQTLQRQLLLEKHQTELTANIDNVQTTINVIDTSNFYQSQDALTLYVKIDDEIMRVDSVDSETELTVTRAQLNTVANAHDIEASCESFYTLTGKPLDLARKIMLSKEGNEYFESLDIPKSINFVSATESIANAVIFDHYNIQDKTGLTVGDFFKLDSALNTGTYTIDGFGTLENGDSYILAKEALTTENEYNNSLSYISKWNTLSTGLGMLTNEVNVSDFDSISSAFGSNFVDYTLFVKDSIDDASDFIQKQLYFPQGLYPITRSARASVKFVVPPFSSDIVNTINTESITNISQVKQRRSAHKYLYNTYVYRYNVDSIEDKYLTGKVTVSATSANRINLGKKQLKIESDGLRNNAATSTVIENITQRYIDRYQFAPVYYENIEVNFKTGFPLEIGDVVPFGGSDIKQVDLSSGKRDSNAKLFEVINKSINIKTGKIKLTLLETSFEINARYAVISLSSNVAATGSTTTRIKITKTNDTDEYVRESDKWLDFSSQNSSRRYKIRVRSNDYTQDETVNLIGVDPTNSDFLLLETPLSFVPDSNHICEVPEYDDTSADIDSEYKLRFAYFNAQAVITSVTDNQTFEVDDGSRIAVGSKIYVHSKDYTRDSFAQDIEIDSIVANLVTLNKPLDFTPQVSDLLDGSDYLDGGFKYAII